VLTYTTNIIIRIQAHRDAFIQVEPELICWYMAAGHGNKALDRNMAAGHGNQALDRNTKSYCKRERKIRLGSAIHQWTKQPKKQTNNYMRQNPSWQANSSEMDKKFPTCLRKPKVHHCFHYRLPTAPILRQINPVRALPAYFLETHFNICLSSTSRNSKWFLSFRFPHQNPVRTSPPPLGVTRSAYLILLDISTQEVWKDGHS